jgi:hypothetical protein
LRYRRLDANGDYVFGGDQASFYIDQPEAPAQAIGTRLKLLLGEWWLDVTDGTPWLTQVLGNRTRATRDVVLKARILGTQGVTGPITNFSSSFDPATRAYSFSATVGTVYGPVQISG